MQHRRGTARYRSLIVAASLLAGSATWSLATEITIMPPDGSRFAVGQRFDVGVTLPAAAITGGGDRELWLDGVKLEPVARELTDRLHLVQRDVSLSAPGPHVVEVRVAGRSVARSRLEAFEWDVASPKTPRARNVILMIGDGMGAAHRTAARLVAHGIENGRARGHLAMDTLPVTGLVMTSSLNAVITDSAPGMSSLVTGAKGNNNQIGVYPDPTSDPFDNPRVEYLAEILRRRRGPGFRTGIVTTADVTDATPAGNLVHSSDRGRALDIAARLVDERERNGLSVLMGGGARHFRPRGVQAGVRSDGRDLASELAAAGFVEVSTAHDLAALRGAAPPARLLGLFHPRHMSVAFDKVGAGRYSDELARPENAALGAQPMLPDMVRAALASLSRHSPDGFYLMVESASIDKRSHDVDAERMIWDVIELDQAVAVALDFARATNGDDDPDNDTLLLVTADHECGGLAIIGVGNERYAPAALGHATRDYAAVFRFDEEQELPFVPNYEIAPDGYPAHPDPTRKLLLGWAAGPDHFENWTSNRRAADAAHVVTVIDERGTRRVAVADPSRDGTGPDAHNQTVEGVPIPGFLIQGAIENGAAGCRAEDGCPADTAAEPHTIAGHTATDVPLGATGPGALQFTGVYENVDVFEKILRSVGGSWPELLREIQ